MGLQCNPLTDCLTLEEKIEPPVVSTRHGMLSLLHSYFDHLGFTAPFLMQGKLLYQQCLATFLDLGRDNPLSTEFTGKWMYFLRQLRNLCKLAISRLFTGLTSNSTVTLHIFCDASKDTYGAVAYIIIQS